MVDGITTIQGKTITFTKNFKITITPIIAITIPTPDGTEMQCKMNP